MQLKRAEPGARTAGVLRPAQDREHILDMGGFEKFEPTIFNERDIAPPKLDLEKVAVMSGAEQHGLPFEHDARLPVVEDMVGDIARLRLLVLGADEVREFGRLLCRIKSFGESLAGPGDNRVRSSEDRLCRSVIAFERDDHGRWQNAARKVEDVAH